jgi:hypothetical protein
VTTFSSGNPFLGCDDLKEFKGKFATEDGRALIDGNIFLSYAEASGAEYNIPSGVTVIGDEAFHGCNLLKVVIPDGVTTIGDHAFYGCKLTEVMIPESVVSIKNKAFWYCTKLMDVYCKPATPPTLGGSYVFDGNASGRKIYVPVGSGSAYQSANNWNKYASDIVETTF